MNLATNAQESPPCTTHRPRQNRQAGRESRTLRPSGQGPAAFPGGGVAGRAQGSGRDDGRSRPRGGYSVGHRARSKPVSTALEIEDGFRILESGCRVEELRNRTAERLQRAAAIDVTVAWCIHLTAPLGRETPDLRSDTSFSDVSFGRSRRSRSPAARTRRAVSEKPSPSSPAAAATSSATTLHRGHR